jgi:hypothetical protein
MPSFFHYKTVDTGSVTLDFDVLEVEGDDGTIPDFDGIRKLWQGAPHGLHSLVTVPRRLLALEFVDSIRSDIQARAVLMRSGNAPEMTDEDSFSQFNVVNAAAVLNARPHRHDYANTHVVPTSSEVSTVLYNPSILATVATEVMCTRSDIASIFDGTIVRTWEYVSSQQSRFVLALSLLELSFANASFQSEHNDKISVLQEIQRETARLNGVLDVHLGDQGSGAILIPMNIIHGRSVLLRTSREAHTAWRYVR